MRIYDTPDGEVLDEAQAASEHSTIETQNALRVKVAELCGWTCEGPYDHWIKNGNVNTRLLGRAHLPNYPSDLNACAEFEKTLPLNKRINYIYELMSMLGHQSHWWSNGINVEHMRQVATATAEQRCRAFVATMEADSQ